MMHRRSFFTALGAGVAATALAAAAAQAAPAAETLGVIEPAAADTITAGPNEPVEMRRHARRRVRRVVRRSRRRTRRIVRRARRRS
jgi:hypothetical protein